MASSGSKYKIMIVDEILTDLEAYSRKLRKLNYEVIIASSPSDALEIAKSTKPELILLEWNLKERDGFALIVEIQQCEEIGDTPVLVFSRSPSKDAVRKALSLGVKDFIIKNATTLAELSQRIKKAIPEVRPANLIEENE